MTAREQPHSHKSTTNKAIARQPARRPASDGGLPTWQSQSIDTGALILRAQLDPGLLAPQDVQHLQRAIGNQAVVQLLQGSLTGRSAGDGRSAERGANGHFPIQRRGGQGNQAGPQTGMFAGLGRIPEALRPIVQVILAAVMEGRLRVTPAQRDALLRLLAAVVSEINNPIPAIGNGVQGAGRAIQVAQGGAPDATAGMIRLSPVVGAILQADAAAFFGGSEIFLPSNFFLRHPLDVTGLGGVFAQGGGAQGQQGGLPRIGGRAAGGNAPTIDIRVLRDMLRRAGNPPDIDIRTLMAMLRQGRFDLGNLAGLDLRAVLSARRMAPGRLLALPGPAAPGNALALPRTLSQPPEILQFLRDLQRYPNARQVVAWTYHAVKFNMAAADDLVPVLIAVPGITQADVNRAATIFRCSKGRLEHVRRWIVAGRRPQKAAMLPHVSPTAGAVGGPAGPYPALHPLGVDGAEWVAYRSSHTALDIARRDMEAAIAANNRRVRDAIDADITQGFLDYTATARQREILTGADVQPKRAVLENLVHYAGHYGSVAKQARLAQLDLLNTNRHANSVGRLWNNWHNARLTPQGKAKFDEMYQAIVTINWNRNPGLHNQPDATRNPTISKYTLGAVQQAVLDGVKNNLGNMRANLDRGPHNTNPTGHGGGTGREYNAAAVSAHAVGTAKWYANAVQPNPVGAKRFIQHTGKWCYSPAHYMGPQGWAGPAAYQLIIDA